MNYLNVSIVRFARLHLRSRLLLVAAAALALYLIADIALLAPQQKKLNHFNQLNKSHKFELDAVNNALTAIKNDPSSAAGQTPGERAIETLKKQVAEVDAFLGQADPSAAQTTSLLKELLEASSGLTLVSLRTLPVEPFYTPEIKPDDKVDGSGVAAREISEAQKTIYKYGVEISVRGNYMDLLSCMENLRKYPRHLFWSGAWLDATYPDAVLKLVIFSLSDQSSSPLR